MAGQERGSVRKSCAGTAKCLHRAKYGKTLFVLSVLKGKGKCEDKYLRGPSLSHSNLKAIGGHYEHALALSQVVIYRPLSSGNDVDLAVY